MNGDLALLAELVKRRNALEEEIARLVHGRLISATWGNSSLHRSLISGLLVPDRTRHMTVGSQPVNWLVRTSM
jgi:hypothetical protein